MLEQVEVAQGDHISKGSTNAESPSNLSRQDRDSIGTEGNKSWPKEEEKQRPSEENEESTYRQILIQDSEALCFFDLFLPVAIALGIYVYRFRGCLRSGLGAKYFYHFFILLSIIYVTIFTIGYGLHVYDWKVVRLYAEIPGLADRLDSGQVKSKTINQEDKEKIWRQRPRDYGDIKDCARTEFYLLGQVRENYLFMEQRPDEKIGYIRSVEKGKVPQMGFDIAHSQSLRELLGHRKRKMSGKKTKEARKLMMQEKDKAREIREIDDPHSRSKCNKSRSDLKWCFVAQAFSGPVVND